MLARRPRKRWREGGRTFERQGMLIREVHLCERCRTYRPANQPACDCGGPPEFAEGCMAHPAPEEVTSGRRNRRDDLKVA